MSTTSEASRGAVAVAGEVRVWLVRRGMSAAQAAQQLGWGQQFLSRRLTGQVEFSVSELFALADLLKVPVRAFFDDNVRYRGTLLLPKQVVNLCN